MTARARSMARSRGASRFAGGVVSALVVASLLAACSDDDAASSSTTTAPADAVCTDAEALSSSVDDLKDMDPISEGADGVTAAVGAVKDDLAAFSESAGDEVQPEVQAVEDAIDELETAVESFSTSSPGTDDDPAATALQAVRGVASSARTLLATLDDGACD